jgi:phage protein D
VYEDMTDADVFKKVVGRAGLTVGKVDATSETYPYIFQRNESDLNFLKRLASRNGYQVVANEGKLDFLKPAFGGDVVTIPAGKLTSLDYEFADQSIPTELTVVGWDYLTKKKVEGKASSGDVQTIGGGSNSVSKTGQIWQAPAFISDVQVSTQSAAKAMAEGELNRLARNFMRGRATVNGTGEVRAGQTVKFEGQRKNFNPEAYVLSVRHTIESTGLHVTQIIFCSNTHAT